MLYRPKHHPTINSGMPNNFHDMRVDSLVRDIGREVEMGMKWKGKERVMYYVCI